MRHCFDLVFLWMSDKNGTDNNTYLLFVIEAESLQNIGQPILPLTHIVDNMLRNIHW